MELLLFLVNDTAATPPNFTELTGFVNADPLIVTGRAAELRAERGRDATHLRDGREGRAGEADDADHRRDYRDDEPNG